MRRRAPRREERVECELDRDVSRSGPTRKSGEFEPQDEREQDQKGLGEGRPVADRCDGSASAAAAAASGARGRGGPLGCSGVSIPP